MLGRYIHELLRRLEKSSYPFLQITPRMGAEGLEKAIDLTTPKQPYFIRLKSQNPLFFGALAQVHPELDPHEGDGFVIITPASDQGMVDIYDRKPLVLTPEYARE